jgi:hypothetical protein
MSNYYRPYFENQRDRERDSGYDRRRVGRRHRDDDFERERRGFRGRDPFESRDWRERESREPYPSHYEGEFGRGRFDEFEDWERPRELSQRGAPSGAAYGYGAGTSSFGQTYRGSASGSRSGEFGGEGRFEPYGRSYDYGPYSGRGPKGYQRSDERLRDDICERLTADPDIDATEIEVSVQSGEVTLEGSVRERRMKREAEDCVESIFGVRDIHNRIRVENQAGREGHEEAGERESTSRVGRFFHGTH